MEFEFEAAKQDPARHLEALARTARSMLGRGDRLQRESYVDGIRVDSSDIARDMAALDEQERLLAGDIGFVVEFPHDAMALGHGPVDVPVDLDLIAHEPTPEYMDRVILVLQEAGLTPKLVSADGVREAFYDRAAETLALRAQLSEGGVLPPNLSMVSSRNAGDYILCAKGWFFSTEVVVGQSTCPVNVNPGRYSLGVSRGNTTRYHGQLFNLPIASIHLDLP